MAEYQVVIKSADGCDISSDIVEGVKAAKERAKYFISNDYARAMGTTHQTLGTYCAEVQDTCTGECLFDFFRKEG